MPLTITEILPTGRFTICDELGRFVGHGRARASTKEPGMVTLYFPQAALSNLKRGLRVPGNWSEERIYVASSED